MNLKISAVLIGKYRACHYRRLKELDPDDIWEFFEKEGILMGNLWTEEQKQVIWLRKPNILVSAAAGSGKTAVLVERILQKITDREHPVDIDRLLIVTFTRAAAAEMRERIGLEIQKRLLADPDNENLQRQETLLFMHRSRRSTVSVSRCFGHIFI